MKKLICPAWLDDEAKKEWKRITKTLLETIDISELDTKAIEGYCQAYSNWRRCEKILLEKGYTFITPNGYEQQRPEVSISNKAIENMRAWSKELGFTPAARARMLKNNASAVSEEQNEDDKEMEDMVVK